MPIVALSNEGQTSSNDPVPLSPDQGRSNACAAIELQFND